MMSKSVVLRRSGVIIRDNLIYNTLLRTIHEFMPYNYSLVEVRSDDGVFKFHTHFEGVQVIDEMFCLGGYRKALEYSPHIVVDVGAHIGTFTILVAHSILNAYGDGLVVSIEPTSINYLALLNNIKLNNVGKLVHPVRAAVAPKPGIVEIEWVGKKEKVRAMTMYDIIDGVGLSNVDLVKMDIEGAELEILTSNNGWLKRVDSIVMELHPQVYGTYGLSKIVKCLRNAGFHVKVVRNRIDEKIALRRFMKSVNPSPTWLALTLWKALVAAFSQELQREYWLATRFKA